MTTPINKEATYIPGPVGKTFSEEEMLKINPDASKEGVFLIDCYVFGWNKESGLYENLGTAVSLLGRHEPGAGYDVVSFTMKGNWDGSGPLPEEGVEIGDCWIWNEHCWARTSQNVWKDYGDVSGVSSPQYLFLQDESLRQLSPLLNPESEAAQSFLSSEQRFIEGLFHQDVFAGYGGTFEQWRSQNGDLAAVLHKASGKDPQDTTRLERVRALEEQRLRIHRRDLLTDTKAHPSLDDVSSLLEGALEKLEGEESDAAFKALDALKKVKVDLRRKRRNTWLRWIFFWAILGAAIYGLYKWIPTQVTSGRYTVPKTCSAPFGNGVIQGMRYYDYGYKSLFGVHMTLESTVRESTIVSMNGQEFSIFGLSPRNEDSDVPGEPMADRVLKAAEVEVETAPKPPKGKWWRMNIWTSDKGTQPMKPAELYLFASEKFTTMVAYKDFCK